MPFSTWRFSESGLALNQWHCFTIPLVVVRVLEYYDIQYELVFKYVATHDSTRYISMRGLLLAMSLPWALYVTVGLVALLAGLPPDSICRICLEGGDNVDDAMAPERLIAPCSCKARHLKAFTSYYESSLHGAHTVTRYENHTAPHHVQYSFGTMH